MADWKPDGTSLTAELISRQYWGFAKQEVCFPRALFPAPQRNVFRNTEPARCEWRRSHQPSAAYQPEHVFKSSWWRSLIYQLCGNAAS